MQLGGCDTCQVDYETDEPHGQMRSALEDQASQAARVACCSALSKALTEAGRVLWVGGYMTGPDRVADRSPFAFGSDATVGIATVAQVGAELLGGVVTLLPMGNRYGALALLRQLVEVEYLAWAFAENEPEAARWLRSSREERRRTWQPRHLRDRSGGRFRAVDYWRHCELGGHPTPEARLALPGHTDRLPATYCWYEAAAHGTSTWGYLIAAAEKFGYGTVMEGLPSVTCLTSAADHWRAIDQLGAVSRKSHHVTQRGAVESLG